MPSFYRMYEYDRWECQGAYENHEARNLYSCFIHKPPERINKKLEHLNSNKRFLFRCHPDRIHLLLLFWWPTYVAYFIQNSGKGTMRPNNTEISNFAIKKASYSRIRFRRIATSSIEKRAFDGWRWHRQHLNVYVQVETKRN